MAGRRQLELAQFLESLLAGPAEELEGREARISEALLEVGTALPAGRLAKVLDRVLATSRLAVYDALGRGPVDHLEPALAAPLRLQSTRRISVDAAGDLYAGFLLAALGAGQLGPAATLARKLTHRVDHMGRLVQTLRQTEVPPAVLPVARSVVQRHQPTSFLDDFPLVYGLLGVLAMDGTAASARTVSAFAEKALARAGGGDDPADRLAYLLGEVGKGREIAALAQSLKQTDRQRAAASEAQAWAEALSLPMKGKPDWRVEVWLAEGRPNTWFGMMQEGPQIHLSIAPGKKPDWEVVLQDVEGNGWRCEGGTLVGGNDLALPKLGTLEAFPRWLTRAGRKLKVTFAVDQAAIGCGRTKRAVPLIRRWLAAG